MNFEEALHLTDAIVFEKTGKHLSDAQRAVLQGTWLHQKYHEIALDYRCTPEYLKQDVGPKLWKLLSDQLGEKVTKKNFRTVIERRSGISLNISDEGLLTNGVLDGVYGTPWTSLEVPVISVVSNGHSLVSTESVHPRMDWGEATDVSRFYGRTQELCQLKQWILLEQCRVIAVLGMGGIGKTSLSVQLAQQIQGEFDYVIWRSLRNAPPLNEILADLIRFLSNETEVSLPPDAYRQISQLIELMRTARCLVILDNAESILQGGNRAGHYYSGYEGYGEFFRRLGETQHQSCLLLTSREKPREIAALEGKTFAVRSLPLVGLEAENCQEIILDKGIVGFQEQWHHLIERYAGNPLALKIVTTTIYDLFEGNVSDFLEQIQQGTAIFGDIRDLLEQQLRRLSELELEIMYWLAINREPSSVVELRKDILSLISPVDLIESLESLSRRSLIEKSVGGFTQQPVVMEYMIERFIEKIVSEIETKVIDYFNRFTILKSQAKDYIREIQIRVILQPIVQQLCNRYRLQGELNQHFKALLLNLKQKAGQTSGYGGGNLINLCHALDFDLDAYDFSNLTIWQAYLQDANLQNVNFSGADLSRTVFAKTLGNSLAVALSSTGKLATGDSEGKILLWSVEDGQQLLVFQGQTGWVKSVAFNCEGRLLASGSEDTTVRIWKVETGECLNRWQGHLEAVTCVDFSPDGKWLASGSEDQRVRIWQIQSGQCRYCFEEHTESIRRVVFSSDSRILASSSDDQMVKLWDMETGECIRTFMGNSAWNWTVVFDANHHAIASSSDDQTVRLWDIQNGQCFQILEGHQDSVWITAFSPDGEILATSSDDQTVKLWQVKTGACIKTLTGQESQVCSLAFSPLGVSLPSGTSQILAIGNVDRMVQLWDVKTGQRLRTLRGHKHQVWSFILSWDGKTLASGSDDQKVRLWDVKTGRCLKRFQGHSDWVWSVAFSADGSLLGSGSYDRTVKLWDVQTGECLKTLHGHSDRVQVVVFSPDGSTLASASDDQTVKLWDVQTGECLHTLEGHRRWVGSLAFSPNGRVLASGSNDQTVRLWDWATGECLGVLTGHTDRVHILTFRGDGEVLASGSYDRSVKLWHKGTHDCITTWQGKIERIQGIIWTPEAQAYVSGTDDENLRLWDVVTGECVQVFSGHTSPVWSVQVSGDSRLLASGSHDQAIRIWDIKTGECLQILRTDKPYHGLNITGVTGITAAQKATLKALGAIDLNRWD